MNQINQSKTNNTSSQKEQDKTSRPKNSLLKSALVMSAGTFFSRILGLVRDTVIASFFDRTLTDAFIVAFRFPNLFRRLLGEGALAVSFIPVFIEQKNKEGEEVAHVTSSSVFTILAGITAFICVLGVVFMPQILGVLVSGKGFQSVPGKMEITIALARIMFSYLFLVTQYAFFMAILNAYQKFWLPAVAPAFFNLSLIVFAVAPSSWWSFPERALAWGVLFGGAVQLSLVFWPLYRMKALPRIQISRIWTPGVQKIFKNIIPGLLGLGIYQALSLINIYFASRLQEGSHSYIFWADRLLELPQSLIAISLGTALLPTLSELVAKNQKDEFLSQGQRAVTSLLFLLLPSALGLYLLAQPIVELVYMRGKFTVLDAQSTAQVLEVYALLLIFSGLNKILVPSFYALQNTWLPAVSAALSLVIHVFCANWGTRVWGLLGLVGATSFSSLVNLLILWFAYRILIGPFYMKVFFKRTWRLVPGLGAMGAGIYFLFPFMTHHLASFLRPLSAQNISLLITILFSVVIYFLICHWMKVPEVTTVLSRFKKKRA